MHCQTPTRCAACLKEFSSLCEAHFHVSKSIDRRGYLYSVHMSDDGHFLVCSAKGGCSDKHIGDHKPNELKEHKSFNGKGVVACSEIFKGQRNSPKSPEETLGQWKSVVAPEDNLGQLKSGVSCQEINEYTDKHKKNQRPSNELGETSEIPNTFLAVDKNETRKSQKQSLEPTSNPFDVVPTVKPKIRKISPQQVFVYSSGHISVFEKEFGVGGSDFAILGNKKPGVTTLKCSSTKRPPDVKMTPAVVKKRIIHVGKTRNDSIKAKFKDPDTDTSAGKCVSSSSLANKLLPQSASADIGVCADLVLPHSSDSKDEIGKSIKTDVSQLKSDYSASPTCNVTPVLLVENQHRRNVYDTSILKNICKISEEEIKGQSTNMNKEVSEQLVTVGSGDKEAFQLAGTTLKGPSLSNQIYQKHGCMFVMPGDKSNISNMLDSSERFELLLEEHNYSKTMNASDDQSQKRKRKDSNIYYHFENEVPIDENINNNPGKLVVEFPDNIIGLHALTEEHPVIAQPSTSVEHSYPCKTNSEIEKTDVSSSLRKKTCPLKAPAKHGRDPNILLELDLKIPSMEEQPVCEFYKYGVKMIQRTDFKIECNMCLKKLSRHEILDHIEILHPHCRQFIHTRFKYESLSTYLKDNWSPDSRFVKITIVRGKRYRFCGFRITPFPDLKFECRSCNNLFCRNDFISHVTDCYRHNEINLTQEFSDQLELLKKIVPVLILEKKKKEENKTAKKEAKIKRTNKTKRNHLHNNLLREFKGFKLKTHMRYSHSSETYTCGVCGRICSSQKALYDHRYHIHIEEGQLPCSVCRKISTAKHRLTNHYRVDCSKMLSPCQLCGKVFKTKRLLRNHSSFHTGARRRFSCHKCKASFKSPNQLRVHTDTVHDFKIMWVCSAPGCESKYKCKAGLEDHIKTHRALMTDIKEMDYGFDGSVKLKTILFEMPAREVTDIDVVGESYDSELISDEDVKQEIVEISTLTEEQIDAVDIKPMDIV